MKKKIISIFLVGVMALSLIGCGGSSGKEESSASSGGNRVTVKMVAWQSGAAEIFKAGAEEFNKRQDKVNFEVEMQTGDYAQYLGAKVASDDLPDMFFLNPYSQVQQFADNGRILDLSDQDFNSKIYESVKDAYTVDGKAYAYPLCVQMLGVFYNLDLFKQAGITETPKTYGQMKEVCEKLKANNITPFAAEYKETWTLNHLFSMLQGTAVGDQKSWTEEMNAGKGSFKNDHSAQAFRFMDLVKENSGSNYMDADSTSGFNAFASGKAAMILSGEWSLLNADSVNPNLNVGVFGTPSTDNPEDAKLDVDVGICVAVNKNSKHLDETLEVLKYLSDNTDKAGWMHYTADSVGGTLPAMEYEAQISKQYFKDYQSYMSSGNTKQWVYLRLASGSGDLIGPEIQGYFTGNSDMETTLKNMDTKYKDLLE